LQKCKLEEKFSLISEGNCVIWLARVKQSVT